MARTPEGAVKERVKKVLTKHGAYWHCPVQNGLGAPSLDFVGCYRGLFYAIETKAGNGKPTPRQETTIADMRKAGAKVFVVNAVSGMDELNEWMGGVSDE